MVEHNDDNFCVVSNENPARAPNKFPEILDNNLEDQEPKKNLLDVFKNAIFSVQLNSQESNNFSSFTKRVRQPLYTLMVALGFHEGGSKRFIHQFYRHLVLFFLFIATIRRATQLTARPPDSLPSTFQETLLNPNIVLFLTKFLFTISALFATLMLSRTREKRKELLMTIDIALENEDCTITVEKARQRTTLLVAAALFMAVLGAIMEINSRYGIFMAYAFWQPSLITHAWYSYLIEAYLTILCQSSIGILATDFHSSCILLGYMIESLCRKTDKNFRNSPIMVKLHYLNEIQSYHHHLITAKRKLEDCYSLNVFCFYTLSIPCTCLLSYVAYRNAGTNPGVILAMGVWVTVIIIVLLILSIPAFQLNEEGENLIACIFDLYQNCLRGEDDPRILTQMLILISQVQSHKMTISAYNYFPLSRGILLTIFSAIFTYFLILVQFSEGQPSNEVDFSRLVEKCRNLTGRLFD